MLISETIRNCSSAIEKRKEAEANRDSAQAYVTALTGLAGVSQRVDKQLCCAEALKNAGIVADNPISQEIRDGFINCVNACGKAIHESSLDKATVQALSVRCDAFAKDLASIWNKDGARYAEGTKGYLAMIGYLTDDPKASKGLVDSINATLSATVSEKSINKLVADVTEAKKIIAGFSLNPSVEGFLKKVSSGSATVADLTPKVSEWLSEHRLMGRLKIRF